MIRINSAYTDYFDNTDPTYPGGKAIDTSNDESEDGTPYKSVWMNDVNGFHQAVIVEARGGFQVSGASDRVGDSDILNALKMIMDARTSAQVSPQFILARLLTVDGLGSGLDAALLGGKPPEYYQAAATAGYFIKDISGAETVIPWLELGLQYAPDLRLAIFISAHGSYDIYKDYISFPYDTKPDGLHIYPQRLQGGKLVGGTPMKKWGEGKWGAGAVFISGRKWGVEKWGEGKWSTSRTLGGESWGGFASMKINLQVKEA
jgi:hypothetical protein